VFKFQHPFYLYALLLLPLFAVLFVWVNWQKQKVIAKLGEDKIVRQLFPDYRYQKFLLKFILLSTSFLFLVLGIANPQVGNKMEKIKQKGVDVIVALDVSRSMNAEDVQPSRLARAKQTILQLIEQLENDRIGLIVFAGRSYLQMPVTSDLGAARMFTANISTDMVNTQGTDIASAIDLANESFQGKDKKYKTLIIITDGEDHEEEALVAAKAANDKGIIINTVGIGMLEGAPIPVNENGVKGYKKDESGNTVISKLNESILKDIATAGKGNYYHLGNTLDEVKAVAGSIDKMEKRTIGEHQFTDYSSYFQYFLAIGFLLLLIEFVIFETPTKWFSKLKASLALIPLFLLLNGSSSFAQIWNTQPERALARYGNQALERKEYYRADSAYDAALKLDKKFAEVYFNYGNSKYGTQELDTAIHFYKKAITYFSDPALKAKAFYNIGTCYLETRDYENAIQAFRKSLMLHPNDLDARYNLCYAKTLLENEIQKAKESKNKNDKKQEQKEPKPSAYAIQLKQKSDALIAKKEYSEALDLLKEGMKKDSSIKVYNDYMKRIADIIEIDK